MSNVKNIDTTQFNAKIEEASELALVDFYADWCGPCKVIGPIVEKLSVDYAGKINFYKLDVDNAADIAAKYSIRGIPTLIIFEGGQVKDSLVGAVSEEQLSSFISKNI